MDDSLKAFIKSYIETALWSSTDFDGSNLDDSKYSDTVFSLDALRKIVRDCTRFKTYDLYTQALNECPRDGHFERVGYIAHDFWLTRNRHGAGFWDGDYPKELGRKLTDLCHEFGEIGIYIGDDGKFYL